MLSLRTLVLTLGIIQAVVAQYGDYGIGNPETNNTVPTVLAAVPSTDAVPEAGTVKNLAVTGDKQCSRVMCVSATVNTTSATVEYQMSAVSAAGSRGWMAMGFGTRMAGTQMVIMWTNADGTTTLSQRTAAGQREPSLTASPARVATLVDKPATAAGALATFTYTVPSNSDTRQPIIWAVGANPASVDPGASLDIHSDKGVLNLNLASTLSGDGEVNPRPTVPNKSGAILPLTMRQNMIIAHAVLCLAGFLLLLPAGALLARLGRTYTNSWFLGHWIFQFGIAAPIILAGVILGFAAVQNVGGDHAQPGHKLLGLILFGLYLVQCGLGGLIHFVKPKSSTRRPPQNYLHAVLGIAIIALSFYQVRTGYKVAWVASGLEALPKPIDYFWIGWMVIVPLAYFGGLALLPKQWKQEQEHKLGLNANGGKADTELFTMAIANGRFSVETFRKADPYAAAAPQLYNVNQGRDYSSKAAEMYSPGPTRAALARRASYTENQYNGGGGGYKSPEREYASPAQERGQGEGYGAQPGGYPYPPPQQRAYPSQQGAYPAQQDNRYPPQQVGGYDPQPKAGAYGGSQNYPRGGAF